MSAFSSNRFDALLGGEEGDTDKLGNTKPVKKSEEPPRTRRDVLNRKQHTRVAVSPPSRRGRDRGTATGGTGDAFDTAGQGGGGPAAQSDEGGRLRRGRKFDRHSGTGLIDSEKKINQGWGHAETAQEDAEGDLPAPDDPAGEGVGGGSGTATPAEPNFKTLDEYKSEGTGLEDRFRRLNARPANEGSDDSKWKDAVPLDKTRDDDVYFAVKEKDTQKKSKAKKEKVFLEIEHPPHRPAGRGDRRGGARGGGRGAGGRGGRGRGGRGGRGRDFVNITDSSAFPTLGA